MQTSILLQNLSPDELTALINKSVKGQLDNFRKNLNTFDPEQLLTREETCKFLQIDSSTLWHWSNKGKVKAYGIGNRRYYKKSEILECLTLLKK
jgi:predicted DNA-binding transcriptional regulator AlpA